jgi:hypothetical protein
MKRASQRLRLRRAERKETWKPRKTQTYGEDIAVAMGNFPCDNGSKIMLLPLLLRGDCCHFDSFLFL